MLTRIIDWSLAHRGVVIVLGLVLVILGLLSFRALDLDAFPDTMPTQVQVNVVAESLTPNEIEQQITMPLEWALTGLPGISELRSISKAGLSQITLQFKEGTDIWFARQVVAERIATIEMPAGVRRPELGPVAAGLGEVFHYLVRGEGKSLEEIREVHDWIIAPQLRSVPGVAEINAWGGAEKQWHVVVDPRRLQQFELSLSDVYEALEKNNANVGGGTVQQGGSAALVLGVGRLAKGTDIGDIVVRAVDGVPVRISDVASVEIGHELRRGAATADGKGETVLGLGFSRLGENGHDVTRALSSRLQQVRSSLPPGFEVEAVHERTTLVDQVMSTVRNNLFIGAMLVIAILFGFLGSLRAGLIVAAAIPFSMLFAFNGMLQFGIAGTLMSLGAIDFGLVVASSVILVENAERRLALDGGKRPTLDVIRDAAVEVRKPSLFGEVIIMVVYLPILALEGVEGGLFRPMALTVIFAILGSVIFSMTLLPVLASLLLRARPSSSPGEDGLNSHRAGGSVEATRVPRLVRWLESIYRPALDRAMAHPRWVLGGAVLLLVATIGLGSTLGTEFIPRLSEGSIVINTVRLADVSLDESVRYGSRIEKVILERFPDEVERIWTRTGTAEVATDPMGVEVSDVFISLAPRQNWSRAETQDELVAEMQAELASMPGMRMSFTQPIEIRNNEMNAGIRSDLGIKIFGDDLDILKGKAAEIERLLLGIEGASDVSADQITGQPVVRVVVDRAAIARHGISANNVLDVVAAVGTRKAGELWEGERRFDVAVRLAEPWRSQPERLRDVPVSAPDGQQIPLGMLTHIEKVTGPGTIERESGKRRVVVQANVRGRDLGSFVAEVQQKVAGGIELPPGYFIGYGGQFEHMERAQSRLLVVVPMALALVFALLWFTYRRLFDCLRIFTGIPFAFIGGIIALWARGLPLSISAVVGFVTLSGIAVLDDMVLVSRIRQLQGKGLGIREAVRGAALSRLRPVLMTSAVATLGFLPMALSTGIGAEVQRPLATVVIGGVLSATLLTLLVLPVLYIVWSRQTSVSGDGDAMGASHAAPAESFAGAGTRVRPAASMGTVSVVLALLLCVGSDVASAQPVPAFSVETAVAQALKEHPDLRQMGSDRDDAVATLSADKRLLPANPILEGAVGPRIGGGGKGDSVDFGISLFQEFEIGGQRGDRIALRQAELDAVEAGIAARRAEVAADARQAFGSAMAAAERLELASAAAEMAREALEAASARAEAGAASQLEVNAARVEIGRTRWELSLADKRSQASLAALRSLMGLPPDQPLRLEGQLGVGSIVEGEMGIASSVEEPHLSEASGAWKRRELIAAESELAAARAAAELASSSAIPNIAVGFIFFGEEDDRIYQGSLAVPLPVFDRKQEDRARAASQVRRAADNLLATQHRLQTEYELAVSRYRSARENVDAFGGDALQALQGNLEMSQAAYQAGKIDFLQLLLLRRETLTAQQAWIDAREELAHAQAELIKVLGRTQ